MAFLLQPDTNDACCDCTQLADTCAPCGCDGNLEATLTVFDEDAYEVIIGSPFAFTIIWAEFEFLDTDGTLQLGWFPSGGGFTPIAFNEGGPIITVSSLARWHCNQGVPVSGSVQINTTDIPAGVGGGSGTLHYKICITIPHA